MFKRFFHTLIHHAGLTAEEAIIYRNFNFLLLFGIADTTVVCMSLSRVAPTWPFWLCLTELGLFTLFLFLHIRGHFVSVRWGTLLITIGLQIIASLTHGPSSGFDYIFYVIAVLPMLFFHEARHYLPIFVITMLTLAAVHYAYNLVPPLILIEGQGLFYWNLMATGILIFGIMYIFKTGYEKGREMLKQKNEEISAQKQEIETINDNLEKLVAERTQKIQDHEHRFTQYAFINAHKVRGPLARIRGLLHLIELEHDKAKALQEHLPALKANTDELNDILKEVSDTLTDTNYPSPTSAAAAPAKTAPASGEASTRRPSAPGRPAT